jgi:hypothetical protein
MYKNQTANANANANATTQQALAGVAVIFFSVGALALAATAKLQAVSRFHPNAHANRLIYVLHLPVF